MAASALTIAGAAYIHPSLTNSHYALFALGCFWGAERRFWQQTGVWVTAVGYAGGQSKNPNYQDVCSGLTGHAEAVLVVFDPAQVSFLELLKVFWQAHDPTQGMRQGNDIGSQYRSDRFIAWIACNLNRQKKVVATTKLV